MINFEQTLIKLSYAAGYVYMLLAIIGILLNTYVIIRLVQLAMQDYHRFKRGCGLPLAAMSVSDLCSLFSIISTVIISSFLPQTLISSVMHLAHCKIMIYMIHTLTGFSTWCWLFISALRYIAVYHPLWHVTGKALGPRTILLMIIVMLILNSWLPIVVFYYPETRTCEEQALSVGANWNRILHGLESLWSYVLPAILTLALDIKVILVRPPSFVNMSQEKRSNFHRFRIPLLMKSAKSRDEWEASTVNKAPRNFLCVSSCTQKQSSPKASIVIHKRKESTTKINSENSLVYRKLSKGKEDKSKSSFDTLNSLQFTCSRSGPSGSTRRERKTVRQWLAITTIHLLFNAPDNVSRLIHVINPTARTNSPIDHIIALVVRLLYFAQFCFNAAYLSAIVYRKNIRPKKKRSNAHKMSNVNLQYHSDYSRSQTRITIPCESRRSSNYYDEFLQRYNVDSKSMQDAEYQQHQKHLQVNPPFGAKPTFSSPSSNGTFKSVDLESNSRGSISNTSLLSTAPHSKIHASVLPNHEEGSAELVTFVDKNETKTSILCSNMSSTQNNWMGENRLIIENLWRI